MSVLGRIDLSGGPEACWRWTGTVVTNGYGQVALAGEKTQAHRFVYERLVGEIPEGFVLDHLCRVKACVNPAHLEVVVQRENVLRGLVPSANRSRCKNDRHELAEVGIYVDSAGTERCRACRLDSKRRYAERRRVA